VRVRVAAPAAALDAAPAPAAAAPAPFAIMASLEEDGDMLARIMRPVEADMAELAAALRGIAGGRHAMLEAAAQQIFGAGGKRLRPMIVLLVARATAQLVGMR
jgi:all-trans-nonaprenyl-diphosphate synthase